MGFDAVTKSTLRSLTLGERLHLASSEKLIGLFDSEKRLFQRGKGLHIWRQKMSEDKEYVCTLSAEMLERAKKELNEDPNTRHLEIKTLRERLDKVPGEKFTTLILAVAVILIVTWGISTVVSAW